MFQERRAQDLERRAQEQESERETERDILKKDLEEYRELSRGLTDQVRPALRPYGVVGMGRGRGSRGWMGGTEVLGEVSSECQGGGHWTICLYLTGLMRLIYS